MSAEQKVELSASEANMIQKVLLETVNEQKRARRWRIFFRILYLLIIVGFFFITFSTRSSLSGRTGIRSKPHVGVVDIKGVIAADEDANADNIVTSLQRALKDPKTVAVILRINSPGGSPVQADDIYNNILRLRQAYPNKPIYSVCSDMCTSAAYYIASATKDIYANQSSIVGSIGVLMNGFGFVDTIKKLGIKRRLITSGNDKGFLDPFSPLKPKDKQEITTMLNLIHEQFIQAVEKGRGARLKIKAPGLFSGRPWTGMQAKNLGLIDGFYSTGSLARKIIKNPNLVDYTRHKNFFQRLSRSMGASFGSGFFHAILSESHQVNIN